MGLLQQGENAVSKRNAAREMFCRENAIVLGERWYAMPNAGPPADVLRREKTAASGDCALFCGVNGLLQQSEIAVLRQSTVKHSEKLYASAKSGSNSLCSPVRNCAAKLE